MAEEAQKIYSLIIDAGGSKAGADLFKRAADQISEAAAKAAAAGKPLTDNVAAAEKAFQRLVTRIDPVTTAQVRMAKEIDVVQRAFAAQKITVEQAATSLQQITTKYEAAIDRAKKLGAGNSGGVFKNIGFAAQQAGYQIGDFAVQVESGTNPMRAAIQQGTQLISMFGGPWGAAIGAGVAVVGSLAAALWDMSSASKDAATSQAHLVEVLKDMDKIQKELDGNAARNRASLQAQLEYDLAQVQAAYDIVKKKADAMPRMIPAIGGGTRENPAYDAVNKQLLEATINLETAKQKAGQVSDSFAKMGQEFKGAGESGGATAKTIKEVTDAMEEQLRVLRLHKQEREADKIVDQKLTELGYTRVSAGQELIKTLTDLAMAQVQQTQANKDQEGADRKTVENTKAVQTVLAGLKKQYDDLSKAPSQTRAENLFAGKLPSKEDLAAAEAWLKKIDELKNQDAADRQSRSEIDQIIDQGTRGVEQRQKWERTSLETQANQVEMLQKQLELSAANDNEAELALAHLKAQQEVHAQMGNALDANAIKYIQNADAIARMNQELKRQQLVAQELPQFFDQAFDRIGSAITQAMATGEISMTSLLDVGRSVVSELAQEFLKLAAINPLKNLFFGEALPTIMDFGGSWLSSLFGSSPYNGAYQGQFGIGNVGQSGMLGHAAKGGFVEVGENGPEKFFPNVSGTIVPNGMQVMPANQNSTGDLRVTLVNQSGTQLQATQGATTRGADGRQYVELILTEVERDFRTNGRVSRAAGDTFGLSRVARRG